MSANLALLLDTHILVWIGEGNPRLSSRVRAEIEQTDIFVSAVVAFEYTELLTRGRFKTNATIAELHADLAFGLLDFPAPLATMAAGLPPIHRDPIDRMLIAHALALDHAIVTADKQIHRYPVRTLW